MTSNPTADLPLPHDDFTAGFRVGWEASMGSSLPVPKLIPMSPRLVALGQSKFTMGVRAGLEAALGVEDLDELHFRKRHA